MWHGGPHQDCPQNFNQIFLLCSVGSLRLPRLEEIWVVPDQPLQWPGSGSHQVMPGHGYPNLSPAARYIPRTIRLVHAIPPKIQVLTVSQLGATLWWVWKEFCLKSKLHPPVMFEAKVRGEKHQCNSLRFSSLNQGSLVFTAGLSCQNPRSLAQSDLGFHTCDLRGIFMSVPYRSTPSRHLHALYL